MKVEEITVEGLIEAIESGECRCIRLSRGELADLFGVYYGTITANIKAIIRSGAVCPSFAGTVVQVGNTVLPERYDMEMVIALAFRLHSPVAERIRRYVVRRVTTGLRQPAPQIFLSCGAGVMVN
jgi:hypothetical protein